MTFQLIYLTRIFSSIKTLLNKNKMSYSLRNPTLSLLLIIYILINGILYLHANSLVYDEAWFFGSRYYKDFTNSLGYGYLYWLFIRLLHFKWILRLLALFSITSVLIIIPKINSKLGFEEPQSKFVTFLWLTFPAAWWYGKLIGPELYCLALGFWGLYLAMPPAESSRKKMIGLMLMGVAVGIKLTSIIFPIFYYSYTTLIFLEQCSDKKNILKKINQYLLKDEKLGIFFILGFLIGSPDIIFKPKLYWQNLTKFSSPELNFSSLENLYTLSVGNFWETVILPSILQFSLAVPAILCLIVFYNKWSLQNRKIVYSFFISLLASLFILIKSQLFFSWYFYPIIVLSLIFFLNIKMPKKYFYIIIFVNLLSSSPIIFAQIANKATLIYYEYNIKSINAYIESKSLIFSKQYPYFNRDISIKPDNGSEILTINSDLASKKPFEKPTFLAVSKIMLHGTDGNNSTIYHHIAEMFNENKIKSFEKRLFALNDERLKYRINFIGSYKNVYIFTVVPVAYE